MLTPEIFQRLNFRLIFLVILLAGLAIVEVVREDRPFFLRPGLHLYAYVANSGDGTLTEVDLVSLSQRATISVGPDPASLRALPRRKQIWGVSGGGGYVWVLDAASGAVTARVPIGTAPAGVDFSPDGRRAYVTASGSSTLSVLDTSTMQLLGRARTGPHPGAPRVTPDGRTVLVPIHDDSTLELYDAQSLAQLAAVPVIPHPEQVDVLPDSSVAYVSAADQDRISSVDLRRRVLLANLQLDGRPGSMILKPDGGELYVTLPDTHGLAIINTWTTEVDESKLVGLTPTDGALTTGDPQLFVSDSAAGRVLPISMSSRHEGSPIPVGRNPGAARLDPSGELLLVANRDSNDLAVIRVRTASLLTLVPVGSHPSDVAVLLF